MRDFKGEVRAVDRVDLEVASGEIFGFLGPNGAGKSTTVMILTTLLGPTLGSARVAGCDVVRRGPEVRSQIGVALQDVALDPMLTANEHMRLQMALQGVPRRERAARCSDLLARFGLADFAERKVAGYSGGMKRRLDLALALVHRPGVLFLDEPTAGLDVQSRHALWKEVSRLASEEGVTVFLTTQYLEEADILASRVAIIDRGKIVADGTPAELKSETGRHSLEIAPQNPADRPRVASVLASFGEQAAGSPRGVTIRLHRGEQQLPAVLRALDEESVEIAKVEVHAPTLDDVFLAKTGRSLDGAQPAGEDRASIADPHLDVLASIGVGASA
ncbi:MAG: ATP-binding cassette domain-containing protein [Solirubrobacteraceae bacterium]